MKILLALIAWDALKWTWRLWFSTVDELYPPPTTEDLLFALDWMIRHEVRVP